MSNMAKRLATLSLQEKRALIAQLAQEKAAAKASVGKKQPSLSPLSLGQEALWFLHQSAPLSPAYNTLLPLRIHSELDVNALRKACQGLSNRHSALRTTFYEQDGKPISKVHAYQEVYFEQIDASTWDEQELKEKATEAYERPFDLEAGPIVRVTLFTRSAHDHLFLLTMPHIVSDFWSASILLDELVVLYAAAKGDTQAVLPPVKRTYADYVRWHSKTLEDKGENLATYWQQQLTAPEDVTLPVLNLPTDARPSVFSFRGASYPFHLTAELSQQLNDLARACGTTLYVTLLAAFQVLLHRYTAQNVVLVGSPISGRTHSELTHIVGYFVNQVVLRADLTDNPTFKSFLAQMRTQVLGALAHQEYPFPLLVKQLQPTRDPSRPPIVQASFLLQKVPSERQIMAQLFAGQIVAVANLSFSLFDMAQQEGQFELSLEMMEKGSSLHGVFKYNSALFGHAQIERMAAHFQVLLEGIVANSEQQIANLPLLTEAERHQLLMAWNDTATPYPKDKCIHQLFSEQAGRTPDAIAVVFGEEVMSYRALNEQSNRLAHYLQSLGVGPETLVGICVERGIEMMVGLLGILKAGGAYVPLDPSYPSERLAYMLDDSQVKVLLTQKALSEQLPNNQAKVIYLDEESPSLFPTTNPMAAVTLDHLIYVIYTSGSTGKPKGVEAIHRNTLNRLNWMWESLPFSEGEILCQKTALSFVDSVWEIFGPLLRGIPTVIIPDMVLKDPKLLVKSLAKEGITRLVLVPSLLRSLLDTYPDLNRHLPQLKYWTCSGEALSTELCQRFYNSMPGRILLNLYGSSEVAGDATWYNTSHSPAGDQYPKGTLSRSGVPIGRPIANTQVFIVNQSVQLVPIGVPGELLIGGDNLARGYHRRAELTKEKFIPNPYDNGLTRLYRTGDLARWLPDTQGAGSGQIEFLGRIDNQVKIRGYRIELGEIEAVLAEDSTVQEAVVVAHTYQVEDKRLIAYIVPTDKSEAEHLKSALISKLRQRSQQKLPAYMVPSFFMILDELPLTPNGKVNRRALPAPTEHVPLEASIVMPQTELEKVLVTIWCEELGIKQVGIHDNFFEVGGHSLLLVKIQTRLQKALNQACTVVDLMRYPTIHTLAQFLAPADSERAPQSDEEAESSLSKPRQVERPTQSEERDTDIAIIGMAGRFPGADSVEAFWQNLSEGKESISRFSDQQLLASGVDAALLANPNYVKAGGVLSEIEQFDASFFGFSPREAKIMDPQIRLFMECAWEALEDAGCNPFQYEGKIGLYAGAGLNTYWHNNLSEGLDPASSVNAYQAMISNDKDFLSTRVSYKLNLQGPSMTVQTACSTSLVATHLACQSLLNGESDMALAGGVSVRVPHEIGYLYQEGMIFSPDGHCRAFDAQAQGTVFGNGLGVVVLKRLVDALADGDVIHAVIKGSAINNDGATKMGYTAPSIDGQILVVRDAMAKAKVTPDTITYIEAHGTGTPLGDPIEMAALSEVFRKHGTLKEGGQRHCAIGAVKTNVGHLDIAAGMAGLIKTTLALKHKQLPPTLHFSEPNPLINLDDSPFYINTELIPWQTNGFPRRAGVSSFGIGGTNAHLILEEAPPRIPIDNTHTWKATSERAHANVAHHLFTLSAKNEKALFELVDRYIDFLASNTEDSLADICFTTHLGRAHFDQRLSLVAPSKAKLRETLSMIRAGEHIEGVSKGQAHHQQRIAFLFTGQGSQYVDMGRTLYETQPTFRHWLDHCDEILRSRLAQPLLSVLYPKTSEMSLLNQTAYTQPALFALEYALAELWKSWGIKPDVVMGHSVGEIVAACVAGVFSLEDGLKLISARGRLMQALPQEGQMVSVMANESHMRDLIAPYQNQVSIAAVNGPQSVVISGKDEAIESIVMQLQAQGIKTRQLTVSHAFHSPLMEPMLADFAQVAEQISYSTPKIAFVSNVTGQLATSEVATAAYWVRHVREAVQFMAGMTTLHEQSCEVFVEIGPKPILLGMGRLSLGASQRDNLGVWLPSLRQERDDWSQMLQSLGQLYVRGYQVDWVGFHRDDPKPRRKMVLPTYPFQRQRYWVDAGAKKGSRQARRPLIDKMTKSPLLSGTLFETEFSLETFPFLSDHRVYGAVISPGACHLALVLSSVELAFANPTCQINDVILPQPLIVPEDGACTVQLLLTPVEGNSTGPEQKREFQLISFPTEQEASSEVQPVEQKPSFHAMGHVVSQFESRAKFVSLDEVRASCQEELAIERLYQAPQMQAMVFGPHFRWVSQIWRGKGEVLGKLRLPDGVGSLSGYVLHPGLLDACFQLSSVTVGNEEEEIEGTFLPFAVEALRFYQPASGDEWWCHVQRVGKHKYDLQLLDTLGQVVAEVRGFQVRAATSETTQTTSLTLPGTLTEEWLYAVTWQSKALDRAAADAAKIEAGSWLLFADQEDIGARLANELHTQGKACMLVVVGQAYHFPQQAKLPIRSEQSQLPITTINPSNPQHIMRLFGDLQQARWPSLCGVIYFAQRPEKRNVEVPQRVLELNGGLLHLVQALIERDLTPKLWVVTENAQAVSEKEALNPVQASLWGLARTIAAEYPELLCTRIDIDDWHNENPQQVLDSLLTELAFSNQDDQDNQDNQIAYRQKERFVARLTRWQQRERALSVEPIQVRLSEYGSPDYLHLQPMNLKHRTLAANEVEIEVHAAGLNFRDVLNVLGMLATHYAEHLGIHRASELALGFECAGIVSAVGDKVSHVSAGDRVMALAVGSLASFVTVNASHVAHLPKGLSFEEAATIPLAFLTAYYALNRLAKLQAGERVLIHAASGGVGQAAVQLAQAVGADVLGTASQKKWNFLKSMGVPNLMNSRTLDFANEIMEMTAGQGVDVVLNSLSGEFIDKSVATLGQNGRFVEIGKLGIWSADEMQSKRPDVAYYPFDLGEETAEQPTLLPSLYNELGSLFEEGSLKPLPRTVFPVEKVSEAVRFMQQAKHIGKIVISFKEPTLNIKKESSYLITGGLGGLGLQVAQQLVAEGAEQLVLAGRRGVTSKETQDVILQLEEAGANVYVVSADVSYETDVARLLAACPKPLRGIIHAAGVLDDGILSQQTVERFQNVMAPKVSGAWHLHRLTQTLPLDFFVCFSSVASLLALGGQGNYAAANAFLDGLMLRRQAMGLPGLSINWGAWAEVGMAAGEQRIGSRLKEQGMGMIAPQEGRQALSMLLKAQPAQVAVLPVDWSRFLPDDPHPFFSTFADHSPPPLKSDFLATLTAAPADKRQGLLMQHLWAAVRKVMGWESSVKLSPYKGLFEMGLDSLMAVELRNLIQSTVKQSLASSLLFNYPTLEKLTNYLLNEVLEFENDNIFPKAPSAEQELDNEQDGTLDSFDTLSDDEIAELLAQELIESE